MPIGGFLVAGVLIGPAQLGVVDSSEAVQATADIGVILLLFTSGSSSRWSGWRGCGRGSPSPVACSWCSRAAPASA
ncbi:hypothetical protein E9549_03445 [Blastococcus sp. MG754426]|uniref:cation:proton antiporter domain-containing protein n=1 Tax=unclassified Blastococcus TaxID=2619396 RepID=UPI001EF080E3|nr:MULTISPECIES: cation:proton antiporter [unclassified Blastococcus]MCF6506466.1 hypothetical protein [Blastococcus sp. MG754426]MCF6511249.1 hypothetical protein [Blastococcus sp. MG754427]